MLGNANGFIRRHQRHRDALLMFLDPFELWRRAVDVAAGRSTAWRYKIIDVQMRAILVPWWWP